MSKRQSKKRKTRKSEQKQGPISAGYLLDTFSHERLNVFKKRRKQISDYYNFVYAALEIQRHQIRDQLVEALSSVEPLQKEIDGWFRTVNHQYTLTPLSFAGSLKWVGGRFNIGRCIDPQRFPPFGCLYIAEDSETALRERFGAPANGVTGLTREELGLVESITLARVSGSLFTIFNLKDQQNLKRFVRLIQKLKIPESYQALAKSASIPKQNPIRCSVELKNSLLEENWRVAPTTYDIPANPQIFAKLVRDAGFEGILYNSTKSNLDCLAIFPDKLHERSAIFLKDTPPDEMKHPRVMTTQNWAEFK